MKIPFRNYIAVNAPTNLLPYQWDSLLDLLASEQEANFYMAMGMIYEWNLDLPQYSWIRLYYAIAAQYQRFGRYSLLTISNYKEAKFWKIKLEQNERILVRGNWYHPNSPEIVLISSDKVFRQHIKFAKHTYRERSLLLLLERHGIRLLNAIYDLFEYVKVRCNK